MLLLLLPFRPAAQLPADAKQLSVFAAQTNYSLPVLTRQGKDYAGLLEILEPLGSVDAHLDGKKWKLHFGGREAQFTVGKEKARVHKSDIDLAAPFLAENGRGLIPLHSLPQVLGELMPERAVSFHEAGRRLLLDKVEISYTAELKKGATGQVLLTFSAPVNPFIATEAGRLRMVFRREPLVVSPGAETVNFGDRVISSLGYGEANGAAELTLSSSSPLTALFSPDRRTITITALSPAAPEAAATASPPSATPSASNSSAATPATGIGIQPPAPGKRGLLVIIDAAHGGEDRGAVFTEQLGEKEIVLTFARRLSAELQSRGVATRLLRESNIALTLEQRAVLANEAAPSLYLAVHAASSGSGVHLFTSDIAAVSPPPAFLPWGSAQAAYVNTSRAIADILAVELLKRDIPALNLRAPVAPLNLIAAPAIAIELSAPAGRTAVELNSVAYQQGLCGAIAAAVAANRGRLPYGEVQ